MNIQTVDNVFSYFRSWVFKSRLLKPIYLEGSSYRESTVSSKKNEKRKNNLKTCPLCLLFLCSSVPSHCSSVPTVPLCLLFLCSHCSCVLLFLCVYCPSVSPVPLCPPFLCAHCSSVPTVPLCLLCLLFLHAYCSSAPLCLLFLCAHFPPSVCPLFLQDSDS